MRRRRGSTGAGYVPMIERDDYQGLRSPAFARGYVRAYGKLLELDEEELIAAFEVPPVLRSRGAGASG